MRKEVLLTMPIPEGSNEAVLFGCFDRRLVPTYRELMEGTHGLSPGQYFPHLTPGALAGFCDDREHIKLQCYNTTKLLFDNDVKKIIIAPHTNCVADAVTQSFKHSDEDFEHQLKKITKFREVVSRYAAQLNVAVPIVSYVVDVKVDGIHVVPIQDAATATS